MSADTDLLAASLLAMNEGEQSPVNLALRKWESSLFDLSAKNQLLYCKPASTKVFLDEADTDAVWALWAGEEVRLSELFPLPVDTDEPLAEEDLDAYRQSFRERLKSLANMRKRMREHEEERGVRVGRFGTAMVTWSSPEPASGGNSRWATTAKSAVLAPLLLKYLVVGPMRPGAVDVTLSVDGEAEVNSSLLELIRRDLGVDVSDTLAEAIATSHPDDLHDYKEPRLALDSLMARVDGWDIHDQSVLGTFAYTSQSMVNDLKSNSAFYAESTLVSALAGVESSMRAIRDEVRDVSPSDPNRVPPKNEFLIVDADPSQNYAINASLAGRNVIVQGPPGTGKSQTISNLIAANVAQGKRVLFVAEKRAAIQAVTSTLAAADLDDVVFDLHSTGATNKAAVAALRAVLNRPPSAVPRSVTENERELEATRAKLLAHEEAINGVRSPWGISAFDAQSHVLTTPASVAVDVTLPDEYLLRMTPEVVAACRGYLEEVAERGGFDTDVRNEWAGATGVDTSAIAQINGLTKTLAEQALPQAQAALRTISARMGMPEPETVSDLPGFVSLLEACAAIYAKWHDTVWTLDLQRLTSLTASKESRRQHGVTASRAEIKNAPKILHGHRVDRDASTAALHDDLIALDQFRRQWHSATGSPLPPPNPTNDLPALRAILLDHAHAGVRWLEGITNESLVQRGIAECGQRVAALAADHRGLTRIAGINEYRHLSAQHGLGNLVDTLMRTGAPPRINARQWASDAFTGVLYRCILDYIERTDFTYASFDGRQHTQIAERFAHADRAHIDSTPARIRRLSAERLDKARADWPGEETVLDKEFAKKGGHKSVKKLLGEATNIIMAAKPCWAMSPLLVSQMLPAQRMFDVVIFDEASQVRTHEGVCAIGRAKKFVIAGDTEQLPPTNFFSKDDSGSDDATDDQLMPATESLLHGASVALGGRLSGSYYLRWHYRSEDARLIAFSNHHFYGNRMTTFPGTQVIPPLSFTYAPQSDAGLLNKTVDTEIETVTQMVLEHARTRPTESLGVITFNINHAENLLAAIDRARTASPGLDRFFDDDKANAFFVKNIERVQGDERDRIIMSIGHGMGPNGKKTNTFGPINGESGYRRLNVAITRAKKSMDIVASFSHEHLNAADSESKGFRNLYDYLKYAATGCQDLGATLGSDRPSNPFEQDVQLRLEEAGIEVIPQYGVAGYWLDFAAKHPTRPGQLVLAIEADGASYHSSETARSRDRQRQQVLERLGWTFHRIWSTDYFRDPEKEIAKAKQAWLKAVAAADLSGSGDGVAQAMPSSATASLDATLLQEAEPPRLRPKPPAVVEPTPEGETVSDATPHRPTQDLRNYAAEREVPASVDIAPVGATQGGHGDRGTVPNSVANKADRDATPEADTLFPEVLAAPPTEVMCVMGCGRLVGPGAAQAGYTVCLRCRRKGCKDPARG